MGVWSDFKDRYREEKQKLLPDPLALDGDNDRGDWPRWIFYERRDIRNHLRNANPVRFARLERDMVWLRRQCERQGLDPEQARWLI